ncbi:DUF917 family protein [Bradyrhizobium genosp. P]|uniref:S-methyl thiohydantoin desulfurase domain-containing protein n=1 Tax=Bradyrhizobium genosp. P TaxID=83641 RepID=UPI003CEC0351
MKRRLGRDDVEAAILGGLLLSAGGSGGSGIARNRAIGEMALAYSGVDLIHPNELAADELAIVASGIGAPASSKPRTEPRHAIESGRLLLREIDKPVTAVMPAHVPGLNAWLQASVLGLDLLDAATNGRGHPTVKLGSMGLAARPDISITQAAVGGRRGETALSVIATGDIGSTSEIMRSAAAANGGLILASRGPFRVDYIRQFGAVGALGFQIGLGRAILEGSVAAEAAARFVRGEILVIGRVAANSVAFDGAFDVGRIEIDSGGRVRLGVCNEFMCADRAGERVYTFPDLVATVDPKTGVGLEISELKVGTEVAVIAAKKDRLPLGAGVLDPAAYDEIEHAMKTDLKTDGSRENILPRTK